MKRGSKVIYLGNSCKGCMLNELKGVDPYPTEGQEYTLSEFTRGGMMITLAEIESRPGLAYHIEDFVESKAPEVPEEKIEEQVAVMSL